MTTSAALALPGSGGSLRGDIALWAHSAALAQLVVAFGGDPSVVPVDVLARLAWLDEFSDRWDVRRGKERDQVADLVLTPGQGAAVAAVIAEWGLRDPQRPRYAEYDHVFALGGLIRACFIRPAYAAHLIKSGAVATQSFVALGGHRPFSDEEFSQAERAGVNGLSDEFGAMEAGTQAAFGLGAPVAERGERSSLPGGSWTVREYACAEPASVLVAAAPSSEPEVRRANTPDTYQWLAEDLIRLRPGQRVLAVTTLAYVPAQHAAAVRMLTLPFGVEVDTVGTDPAHIPAVWDQEFSATRYLLEVRSAIRALRALTESAG